MELKVLNEERGIPRVVVGLGIYRQKGRAVHALGGLHAPVIRIRDDG